MTLDEYLTKLNQERAESGKPKMTDEAFGKLVGLSQSHVSRLRNGVVRPSWKAADAIATATGQKVKATAEDWPARETAA